MKQSPAPRIDSPTFLPGAHERAAGTLVLIGGACTPDGMALRAFVDEVTKVGGPIVGITAASADPTGSAALWMGDFASIGVTDVHFPPVSRTDAKVDREMAARIDDATAQQGSSLAAATR